MIRITPLPIPMRMLNPAVLIATGLGSGRIYPAPGTWGSLAGWVIAMAMLMLQGKAILILALLFACFAGWWAIESFEEQSGDHDAGMIVIDEWAGLWLAMLLCPLHPILLVLSLVLFRLFDIWKPGPIGWLDKHVHGPAGVLLDDLAAGLATAACVSLVGLWIV